MRLSQRVDETREEFNARQLGYYLVRRAAQRKWAEELLGSRCAECGSTQGLEFDHIDPTGKSTDIGKMLGNRSDETIERDGVKIEVDSASL